MGQLEKKMKQALLDAKKCVEFYRSGPQGLTPKHFMWVMAPDHEYYNIAPYDLKDFDKVEYGAATPYRYSNEKIFEEVMSYIVEKNPKGEKLKHNIIYFQIPVGEIMDISGFNKNFRNPYKVLLPPDTMKVLDAYRLAGQAINQSIQKVKGIKAEILHLRKFVPDYEVELSDSDVIHFVNTDF
jgi:hypothetical protein